MGKPLDRRRRHELKVKVRAEVNRLVTLGTAPSERKLKAAVTQTMKTVAGQLGNTPAVSKRSYVDPVLVSHFEAGRIADA